MALPTSSAGPTHASAYEAPVSSVGIAAEVASQNAHLPAVALTEHQQKVVKFYEGQRYYANNDGVLVNIEAVKNYTSFKLEEEHQFIQPLFPIDTVSGNNVDAPALDGQDFPALRGDTRVSEGLDEAFDMMLKYFGLRWEKESIAVHDRVRAQYCFRQGNHNNLRASRMIRSMALFGKMAKAKALQAFLKDFCKDIAPPHDSIAHWARALNDPVAMNKAGTERPDYPGLLFPNKSLLGGNEAPCLGRIKQALFDRQQQFYETASLHTQHIATPLIARFTKSTISDGYAKNNHLEEGFNPPNPCNLLSRPNFYFGADIPGEVQPPQHPPYEVHVDFANQSFGGTWKHDGSFAQEEVAFIENIGLDRVADEAPRNARRNHPLPLPNESGIAYATRRDGGVPSPIIIEGCERVAHLNQYGGRAALLKENIVKPNYF